VADAKKPESYTVAEETQWKTWKFKEIITKAMEDENLRLRKEIASFEAKFSNQDRIHAALTSTLDTVQAHNQTLKNAVESAEKLTAVYASEVSKLKKLLRTVYRQNDLLKRNIGLKQGNHLKVPEPESGILFSIII
jgi:septal ring factor EnvC (AmiA/AmiB activator)